MRIKTTVTEARASVQRLIEVAGAEGVLDMCQDNGKVRLFAMQDGRPVLLGDKFLSPSAMVAAATFATDLLRFLAEDDDSDESGMAVAV